MMTHTENLITELRKALDERRLRSWALAAGVPYASAHGLATRGMENPSLRNLSKLEGALADKGAARSVA